VTADRYGSTFNFASILRRHAEQRGDQPALIDVAAAHAYTFADLDKRVDALASILRDDGVRAKDVVALLMFNRAEFLEVLFATNRLGAIFLPLNWRLATEELMYVLGNAAARVLVSEPAFYSVLGTVLEHVESLAGLRSLDDRPPTPWKSLSEIGGRLRDGVRVADAAVEPDDLHRLMYTSGTTAHPKGVMISYDNLYWKNVSHILEFGINGADRTLIVGPLYHVGALDLPGVGTLYAGGSLVILPKFDVSGVLGAIDRERPTNVWLAPAMVSALLEASDLASYDLSSIRFIIDGGEKMPVPLIRRLGEAFPNAWFADAYGLTETVSGDTFLDKARVIEKIGSVGKPVAHLELRVVGDDGGDVPSNTPGEIVLRGPKVFRGYWRNEEATRAAIDATGWFHTGDIGRLDDDGYLYIVDRKKDMIISGGENIASLEVERVLYDHPAVLECAVVGQRHPRWGEVPVAFVVVRPQRPVTADELIGACTGRLAKFKVPTAVHFIEQLPRTPSGKVLKRALRERLEADLA
jgi:fatty-acyl-CoA synthase